MKYLTVIVLVIFVTSCANRGSKQKTAKEEVVVHEAQTDVVTLDNGKRWKANFATTRGISNMKKLVKNVNNDSRIEDYRQLGEDLRKEFRQIFQRCDMTGEAHNQLHNYLHPMVGWFETLKEGNLDECRKATDEFREHLDEYDRFFK